jgi:uncharacterized protein (TIRG00374 family)
MQLDSVPPTTTKRRSWLWLQILGGLLAFAFLFWKLPWAESWRTLQGARPLPIILAMLSLFAVHVWTWTSHVYLLQTLAKPQPAFWFFRAMLLSQVVGMFAPGKLGDLSIAWFLRKRAVPYGEGLALGMYYKMIALAVTFWLGMAALAKLTDGMELFLFVLTLPVGLLVISKVAAKWIVPNLPRLMPHAKIAEEMRTFSRAWNVLSNFKPTGMSLLLALLKALNMTLTPWLILQAFGQPVTFFTTLALSSLVRLASAIPISPSGLGVRELSGTIVFNELAGVPWAIAGSMMLLSTVMQYATAAICYGASVSVLSAPREKSK